MKTTFTLLILIAGSLLITGCGKQSVHRELTPADSVRILNESLQYRAQADSFFQYSPQSPFNGDTAIPYEGIRRFPPDVQYHVTSKLHKYDNPDTVIVYGTKGEPRKQLRYGYFVISIDGSEEKLNVYKFAAADIEQFPYLMNYLSVWFTDGTTGKETYEVGRYLDVGEEQSATDAEYVINFNNAYNPYCAYNPKYSCAIPTKDDRLNISIRAGEMKYHQ